MQSETHGTAGSDVRTDRVLSSAGPGAIPGTLIYGKYEWLGRACRHQAVPAAIHKPMACRGIHTAAAGIGLTYRPESLIIRRTGRSL